MKKLIVMLIFLICAVGYSQQLHIGPIHTIEWDAVISPQGVISYEIWLRDVAGTEIFVTEVSDTMYTVDISVYEDVLDIGVDTKLVFNGVSYHSGINWSNINGEWTPDPFVLWRAVRKVKNLRRQ